MVDYFCTHCKKIVNPHQNLAGYIICSECYLASTKHGTLEIHVVEEKKDE